MKSYLSVMLLLCLTYSSSAQTQKDRTAGDELILAQKNFHMGVAFVAVGTGALLLSLSSTDNGSSSNILQYGSYICNLAGIIFIVESYIHIGKAGKLLNSQGAGTTLSVTRNGIGLAYRF